MKVGNKLKKNKTKRIVKGKEKRNERIKIETESDLSKLSLNTINNSKIYMFYGKYYDKIYNKAIQIEKTNNKIVPDDIILPKKVKKIIKIKKKVLKKRNSKSFINKNKDNNIDAKNKSSLATKNKAHYKINKNTIFNDIYKKNEDIKEDLTGRFFLTNIPVIRGFKLNIINFEIKYNTIFGESLALIGSINELGLWDQSKALNMEWNEGNIWKCCLNLNNYINMIDFEYKFIVLEGNKIKFWEDGENRKLITSQIEMLFGNFKDNKYIEKNDIICVNNVKNQSFIYNNSNYCLTIVSHWNIK